MFLFPNFLIKRWVMKNIFKILSLIFIFVILISIAVVTRTPGFNICTSKNSNNQILWNSDDTLLEIEPMLAHVAD
jgi:hypothetical protein